MRSRIMIVLVNSGMTGASYAAEIPVCIMH